MPKKVWTDSVVRKLVAYVNRHRGEKTIRLLCADFASEYHLNPDATYWKYYRISEPFGYPRKSTFRNSDKFKKIFSYVQSHRTSK